jgi:adenylate kinase family enzyme
VSAAARSDAPQVSSIPRRINVTGNAGSGKTTLALQIGRRLDLPVHHLDSVVWQPRWKKTDPHTRRALEEQLTRRESWVIDGVSKHIRERADLVVFLDLPRPKCVLRAMKRNVPYLFRSRLGLPEKCPEILIVPRLLKIIWRFPSRVRPAILEEAEGSARYHVVVCEDDVQSLWDLLI